MSVLPADCIRIVLNYCNTREASNVYLVCRYWYNSMDRYWCLGDKYYYLPDTVFDIEKGCSLFFSSNRLCNCDDKKQSLFHRGSTDDRWNSLKSIRLCISNEQEIPAFVTGMSLL
eukprot:PhF_6_TR33924/c0_g1_i1/m.49746